VRPCPAYVLTRASELLAANPEALTLFAGLADWPPERRNTIRYTFFHPAAELLHGSPDFARLWQRHDVRQRRGEAKPFRHPRVGELTLAYEVLHLADGQRMTVYQAEPASRDHDALTLLSMIASGRRARETNVARERPYADGAVRVRMHGMCSRALSFGAMAEAYERFRPGLSRGAV
jgi:MmyB-like transcription regulator ligand binding domain